MIGNMGIKTYTDAERMRFLSKHGPKQFEGVSIDLDELSHKVARNEHITCDLYADEPSDGVDDSQPVRDEPNEDDRLEAFRMIVDMAIEFEMRRPYIELLTALDKPTFERCCLVYMGEVPQSIGSLNNRDLGMLSLMAERIVKKS